MNGVVENVFGIVLGMILFFIIISIFYKIASIIGGYIFRFFKWILHLLWH